MSRNVSLGILSKNKAHTYNKFLSPNQTFPLEHTEVLTQGDNQTCSAFLGFSDDFNKARTDGTPYPVSLT